MQLINGEIHVRKRDLTVGASSDIGLPSNYALNLKAIVDAKTDLGAFPRFVKRKPR